MVLAGGVVVAGFGQEKPDAGKATVSAEKTSATVLTPTAPAEAGSRAGTSSPVKVQLSPWSLEVQKLAQAQVEEDVMLAYVTNSPGVFGLSADEIIHFKNVGVSQQVIHAIIEHDRTSPSGVRPVMEANAPGVMTAPPAPAEGGPQLVVNDESWADEPALIEEAYYVPEQPESIGPVRAPYPVKLNDPIVILKLPSITVPYW
jgi:hypothetical protein